MHILRAFFMWEPLNNILKFDKNTSLNLPDQGKGLLNRLKSCIFPLLLATAYSPLIPVYYGTWQICKIQQCVP